MVIIFRIVGMPYVFMNQTLNTCKPILFIFVYCLTKTCFASMNVDILVLTQSKTFIGLLMRYCIGYKQQAES